eukprot:TRINITY_DN8943_c3_g1_i1.p1 TRINITY_DN8943_c3_g1~~TRINITY_DN8943_c3_g1_i1.p1  ORF type:complete len:488 (+),score=247.96 TRINITY_DN8943_c3_g1_i1:78-1541(+)
MAWEVLYPFSAIYAADAKGGIGKDGTLPWRLPGDMKHFKEVTLKPSTSKIDTTVQQNVVIMGRKTYMSIPERFRPLEGRLNVVLSNTVTKDDIAPGVANVEVVKGGLADALKMLTTEQFLPRVDRVFVIGGAALIESSFKDREVRAALHSIYLTHIDGDFSCDVNVQFDAAKEGFYGATLSDDFTEGETTYRFAKYVKNNREEQQYLEMVQDIILTGYKKGDRTGVGTLSKFGAQMRFSLRDGVFPLLTTKRVFWKGVAEELFWFIKGSTNGKTLKEKGVGIWDDNGTREFLDSRGLTNREEGDLGPIYGFQWRHFGAEYDTCHSEYKGKGKDQLAEVIHKIKHNPNDRRIIMSAWNPLALDDMALPPCHVMCQFYVAGGELSCQMYQRSCDMGLGVPFNIASYALLTVIIAHMTGLKPGDFIHSMGDTHVYTNHVEPLKQQLERNPRPFPTLKVLRHHDNIEDYEMSDFKIIEYAPYPTIKMEMAV